MSKLNFAIIGCGRISQKHVEALVNNKDSAVLVATCDINMNKAKSISGNYLKVIGNNLGVNCYSDYKTMIEQENIDVVTIATESGYHAEIAIYCMGKRKHVLVEKPMALSVYDANKMIEISRFNNVKLAVCHQNRFNSAIKELRRAIEFGGFGRVMNGTARILWNRNDEYYKQASWRGTWRLDGGTLMNQCIHNIDLLQWMLGGQVETVYSQCNTFLRNIEGEDFGVIIIKFKNGTIGLVEGTACVYPQNLEETLSIFGEKGTVCVGGMAVNEIETWNFKENNINRQTINFEKIDNVYGVGHTPLFKDLIESIICNKNPLVDGEEGKKAMEIVLAAYKSVKTKMPVNFPFGEFSTLDMEK